MDPLQIQSRQQPGLVAIDNFQEMRAALTAVLARYENVVYTEAMLSDAKADKKELTRLRKELDDRRKEVKKAYMAPYLVFEDQVKELIAMIDAPLNEIKAFVAAMEEREKAAKRGEIEAYFRSRCGALGGMADQVLHSPAFFDAKWLNKTTSAKAWQAAVDARIADATRDLGSIQAVGGQHTTALTEKYLETLNTEGLAAYRSKLAAMEHAAAPASAPLPGEDRRSGYKVLKLTGTPEQMTQVLELLELAGVAWEELEDGMPQPMPELERPDFDSFVAFDIETTGTYGAANGDAPAEITEIGAVKVVDGQIVERFSELVNPGRKILPRIARITHITDEMVADRPGIDEVIRKFAAFVGDSVLVGHNIKASDLYYIDRAARRAGVRMENAFFDTYRYARTCREAQGWENVKLEYLSRQFGMEQPDAHRAWCDAEANVGVYFKLKELP